MNNRDLVLGMSPAGVPNARIVAAVCRGGGLGVLDLADGGRWSRQSVELSAEWTQETFGVRVPYGCALRPDDIDRLAPGRVDTVVLGWNSPWQVADIAGRYRVIVEVTDLAEAMAAVAAGADGLIARGSEAGGRVGELSSFVLLQQLLAEPRIEVPIWLAGGIGLHTAPASVIGGAAGVVLDSQLSLLPEAELPGRTTAAIEAMDGSETVLIGGHRVLRNRERPQQLTDLEVAERLHSSDFVPIGQDGLLASIFASRFADVAAAVRGVRAEIVRATGDDSIFALRERPMPIAQGPMTRVSDQPAFAAAVAGAGGIPFIALALSTADQTRSVLQRTATELAAQPWGVGVLGFAPEETRSAQLDVIREIRPAYAIVAGGRPSQAQALEDVGISTFLHVPSPGLLKQFLDAGARKFIFEGSECGGHIGPRASFPLWEAQLAVLTDFLDSAADAGSDLQIFFAGGVHDARSAAMVAVLAAPLAARGARAGILMGTAYLFTEEAVACGAVQPVFQRQVLAAQETALLETAPGHATRAVASPFTESFRSARHALEADGVPSREVWQRLEELNIGRLRIASKGLRRDGAELVTVDADGQHDDGLFMAGQVAVLRSTATSVAALHESVTTGAADFLAERIRVAEPVVDLAPPDPLDIAIVGISCMFAQAADLDEFWANIVAGKDAVTEIPAERWNADTYYSPDGNAGSTSSKWGAFLPEIPFDPLRYGIPPAALRSIEPSQLLALEASRRALEDAGYATGDHSRTAVVFGAEAGSDLSNAGVLRNLLPAYLGAIPPELDEQLPTLTEDSFPGVLANVIAGRVANRLDLGGANYTVDAACASSLAAVDVACKELTAGSSDLVLCGGVDLHNGINDYLLFSSVHALSPTGRSRTFDAAADGIALGEGVACVALKRLTDARRDGDRVYAVVKGIGSASDGRALGLTAPRPEGQRRALERAYRNAQISPADVGLLEAHGTGTVVGDRTELATLTAVFTEAGAEPGSCALGSVKSQIGHTKCAAGMAGLIKAAMALYNGVKPPTINLEKPNLAWDEGSSPFSFYTSPRPWSAPAADRVAGVSAFGFGGTNFHVVLGGSPGPDRRHGLDSWPAELFCFAGADRAAAQRAVAKLLQLIATNDEHHRPWRLRDLARTASTSGPARIAVVASDLDELATLLQRAVAGEHDPAAGLFQPESPTGGKVAFLFPGQGSQRPGMLADLFVAFPEVQHYLRLGDQWADRIFPPAAFDPEHLTVHDGHIRDTRVAQPALGIAGLAVDHLLRRVGVRPDMAGGHSYGELVALASAGVFDARTLLDLSSARAEAILAAAGDDPGAMAAASASADQVADVLGATPDVVLANHNAPRQIVLSGPTDAVEAAVQVLRAAGIGAKRIPVACAFHSRWSAPRVRRLPTCWPRDGWNRLTYRCGRIAAPSRMATTSEPSWRRRSAHRCGLSMRSKECTPPGRGSLSRPVRAGCSVGL